jgi:hypothetical protein
VTSNAAGTSAPERRLLCNGRYQRVNNFLIARGEERVQKRGCGNLKHYKITSIRYKEKEVRKGSRRKGRWEKKREGVENATYLLGWFKMQSTGR